MSFAALVIRILVCLGVLWPGSWASTGEILSPDGAIAVQDGGDDDPEDEKKKKKEKGDGEDDEDSDEESEDGEGEDDEEETGDDEEDEEEEPEEEPEEASVLVTIEFLTSIEWRRGQDVPDEVMAFDGKRVKIAGYMATGTPMGSETFELVPQSCECGRSKLHHFVHVTIEDGSGATFDPGRRQFEGTLSIGEEEDEDGFVTSLYRLTVETFDPQDPEDEGRGPN